MPQREPLTRSRRIVVKVGSRSLADSTEAQDRLVDELAELASERRSFVLVSSGAIAIGLKRLGYRTRPKEVALLQAAAAAGQSVLMRRYDERFAEHGLTAAQVLLTHADLADRERANNARQALGALLEAGAVPVINENDTVATEEIRFGDNDQLASMVTPLVSADLLVLLTDVEGVLDDNGKRIPVWSSNTTLGKVESKREKVGTGGMQSKLNAALKACRAGANAVIAPATRPGVIRDILAGKDVGTLFPAAASALRARKHWIAFTLRPKGAILLDEGAVKVLRGGKASLLPIGVLGVRGSFDPGDAVSLLAPDGTEVGRGLTRLGAVDVARSARHKCEDLRASFGEQDVIVVHKDDLVIDT
jgi:glutamate 5-kinase